MTDTTQLQGAATWQIDWHDVRAIAHLLWKFPDDSYSYFLVML